jgi:transcriptional regulator with XRE-family HTH domain
MIRKGEETGVAERLRAAREASGLSQGQTAQKMNMHRPTVTEIEAGRRKVSAQEVEKFAELYGVTAEWIVTGHADENGSDARLVIAARELSKMNEKDLDRLMKMLKMFRKASS